MDEESDKMRRKIYAPNKKKIKIRRMRLSENKIKTSELEMSSWRDGNSSIAAPVIRFAIESPGLIEDDWRFGLS